MSKQLRSLDAFGAPIRVNFKGEDTFKTRLGGLLSIFTFTLLLMYVVREMLLTINRKEANFTSLTTAINL